LARLVETTLQPHISSLIGDQNALVYAIEKSIPLIITMEIMLFIFFFSICNMMSAVSYEHREINP